ncbi:hypothetical protein Tco_0696864 [Tanacetum coccineum]
MRIDPTKTQKEPTYQVFLVALALTTCYHAFLITADVPEIYMPHVQRDLPDLSRIPNQDYDELSLDEEIISFIKELGHKGDVKSITEVVVDQMYQPWRTFATIINNYLSGKITNFTFQIDNRYHKKQEKMYYPIFTKAIIYHIISKDKTISMRNRLFIHTAQKDSVLGTLRFVSKFDEHQVYGALLHEEMKNHNIRNFPAYKTYHPYATGATTPKKVRNFKKPPSPSKKRTLVTVEEEEPEPAKKDVPYKKPSRKQSTSLNKVLKRSKQDTSIHQAGSSGDGTGSKPGVPGEPKGKSVNTSEGTGLKPGVPDVSKADSSESKYESWGHSGDEDADDQ